MSEYKLDYFQYMLILLLNTKASASLILHKRLLYNIAVCVCMYMWIIDIHTYTHT